MKIHFLNLLRTASICCIFSFLCFLETSAQTATTPAGDGTSGNPFQIATLNNLYWISQNSAQWSKYYIQTADIDASSSSSWVGNAGWSPIGDYTIKFTGTYNGQGYRITGLYLNRSGNDYQGMFGYTLGSTIKNLGLINTNISGHGFVGGLVGYHYSNSLIDNCFTTGSVSGNNYESVGGMAGTNHSSSTIRNSYSSCSTVMTGTSGSLYSTGGLVGFNAYSTVSNCYSTGSVTAINGVGGLVGNNTSSTIINSYSSGSVNGSGTSIGGLVGGNYSGSTVSNSFWNKETSGRATSSAGTGKTTAEMKNYTTFINAGWDFIAETANGSTDYWGINLNENNGYPFLAWQGYSHILPCTVSTQNVSAITTTTATGNGNITYLGYPNPSQHGVCWSTSTNPTISDSKTVNGSASSTGAFTSGITGLSPGTTYFVRAYATNTAGTSYGTQVEFTTLLLPVVTTDVVTDITVTTAKANGTTTLLGIPNPTQHGFCWSTLANPTVSHSKTEEGIQSATGSFSSLMTGLSINTTYFVRAYATNTAGTVYGNQQQFNTCEALPVFTTSTTNYDFGSKTVGSTSSTTIIITNSGGSNLNITGITTPDAAYTITPTSASIACGGNQIFTLTFKPVTNRSFNGNMSFADNIGNHSISINGSGVYQPEASAINCIYFDGSNDYVQTNLDAQPTAIPVTTWEAWIKPTRLNYSTDYQGILTTDNGGWDRGIWIVPGTSQLIIGYGTNGWNPGVTLSPNIWYHIAIVYKANDVQFFLNGKQFTLGQAPVGQATTYSFTIGANQGGASQRFQGEIDEVRVWNTARTKEQIQSSYSPLSGNESGLVGYWRMDEGSEITTGDGTGHSYTGTLMNNPTRVIPSSAPVFAPLFNTSPSIVDFGNVAVNSTTNLSLIITNNGGGFINISSIALPDAAYSISPSSANIAAGSNQIFNVTFSPINQGEHNGMIIFTDNVGNQSIPIKGGIPIIVPVVTTPVSYITTSTAYSGGSISFYGGSSTTSRGICWNTLPSPTISNFTTSDGNGSGSFISEITGLSPATTYYLRAYATNSSGTAYGNELTFTTAETAQIPRMPTYTGTKTICTGNSTTLTAQGETGATFSWWNALTGGTLIQTGSTLSTPVFAIAERYYYYVSQTFNGFTSDRKEIEIAVNQTPVVAPTATPSTICFGNTSVLSATGADTYIWNPGNLTSSPSVSPTINSTYTVTGTTLNCTSAPVNVTVSVKSIASITDQTICLGNSATLTTSGADSYLWQPGNLTGSSVSVSPLTTTTYTVTGTHINEGCTTSKTVTVNVNPKPESLSVTPDLTITAGSKSTLSASATGASNYNWITNFQSFNPTSGSSITVVPTTTTTYTVTASTTLGCTSTAQVVVNVLPLPILTSTSTVCSGTTTTLTVTGTGPFTWYGAETGGNLLYTGATFTTPILTANTSYWVSDNNGSRKEIRLQVVSTPTNVTAIPATICFETSSLLRANVNYGKILWYTEATGGTAIDSTLNGQNLTVRPVQTKTYYAEAKTVQVINTYNYTGSLQAFIVPDGVTSIEIDAYAARGGHRYDSGGPGYGGNGGRVQCTMNVTPGQTLNLYVGSKGANTNGGYNGGGYKTVTNGGGGGGGGATDIRLGGTALTDRVLVAGGGGGSGTSNVAERTNGGAGGGLSGAAGAQNYTYAGYIPGGGGGTQTSGGNRVCFESCSNYGAFGQGGNSNYIIWYNSPANGGGGGGGWYGGGGGNFDSGGGGGSSYTNPALCQNVIHTMGESNDNGRLTIKYAKSCSSARVPVTVTVQNCLPSISTLTVTDINISTVTCKGNITDLGGPSPTQHGVCWNTLPNPDITNYKVEQGSVLTTGEFVSFVTGLTSGTTYYIRAFATNIEGTVYSDDVIFTTAVPSQIPEVPTYSGVTTICTGNNATLTAHGETGATFSWWNAPSGGTLIQSGPTFSTPVFATAKRYYYYVTQTLNGFTSDRKDVEITVNQTPVVTPMATPLTICYGASSVLSATGADAYAWNPGGLSGTPSVSPLVATTYTVVGTTLNCSSNPVNITVNVDGLINTIPDRTICSGNNTTLTTSGADTYLWQPGNLTGISVTVTPNTTTTYSVTGTHTVSGCTSARSVIVTVNQTPPAPITSDFSITAGSKATLSASSAGATTYNWTSNFANSGTLTGSSVVVIPTITTTYSVTASSNQGCSSTSQLIVTVLPVSVVTGTLIVCNGGTTTLTASGTGPFTWYDAETGGKLLFTGAAFTTPSLAVSTSYWVSDNGGPLKEVKVNVISAPTNLTATPGTICLGTPSSLKADVSSGKIKWYTSASGGTAIDSTLSGVSLIVNPTTTTTYYAEAKTYLIESTFNYTGGVQTFTVPSGVTSINIEAYGAEGRNGSPYNTDAGIGGKGGMVQSTINVTPGQTYYIYVGGLGGSATVGYNGGGGWPWLTYSVGLGGTGGGATDIRVGGQALSDRVLVAGGGGGGSWYRQVGGSGGGLSGGTGSYNNYQENSGKGGSQTGGGQGGCWTTYNAGCAQTGGFGYGGNLAGWGPSSGNNYYGGAGGGGWYGGGGGTMYAGGGGGSSYTNPLLCANVIHTMGIRNGHGSLKIKYLAECTTSRIPVTVTVNICPPVVTTQLVTNITSTTATGNGTITNLGVPNPTAYGFCWNTSTEPTISNSKTNAGVASAIGTFTSAITGLSPNTIYHLRAYATNATATVYGEVVDFTTVTAGTWTGATNTDWTTSTNWAGGSVPDPATDVIIPDVANDPIIGPAASANCNNLTVNSGASLTIASTGSGTGSLIVGGTSTGTVTVERFMTANAWHLISSPVSSQSIASFLVTNALIPTKPSTTTRAMKSYIESTDLWSDLFTNSTSGDLGGGSGSVVWPSADGFVSFRGALQTGTTNVSVARNRFGWNCVGNPYSSNIAINANAGTASGTGNFININSSNIDPSYTAIYVWEQGNDAYTIINQSSGAFYAQVGQGFFVKARTGGGTVSFTPSMQAHQTGAGFKSGFLPWPEIKLKATLGDLSNNTIVRFNMNMSKGMDFGYDAGILKSGFDIYTRLVKDNGVDFGIQCLPLVENDEIIIPIGLESSAKGIVSFSAEVSQLPSQCLVTLEDRELGIFTSLTKGGSYTAPVAANSKVTGRFFLHTLNSTNMFEISGLPEGWTVYTANGQICISGAVKGNATATVYDLLGRKMRVCILQSGSLNYIPSSNLRNGVYLLNIRQEGKSITSKIPVNN